MVRLPGRRDEGRPRPGHIGVDLVAGSDVTWPGPGRRGVGLAAVGAVLIACGVGLAPHLIRNGATAMSAVSVTCAAIGIASVAVGTRSVLCRRHPMVKVAGGAAMLVVVAGAVSIIAPALAATQVPSTEVTATPADLGMAYESLTLRTSDGVDLAAWYVGGTRRAGVLVRHGAGSTRSDVLDRAAVLVDAGYSVLLLDARGHGDSGGVAMDFGWFGDRDIAAGTEYLASRSDLDPGRIGAVGFSMGGEEVVGAAATDLRIRAVIAEGVTGRQADDKAWFSDVYGWRGWMQERLEHLQYGLTDLLTDASPPIALRSAVAAAPMTAFLLITAGDVNDEGRAAAYIRSGASDRVSVWDVEGAGHTDGYEAQPEAWRRHVVEFLDEHLS